MAKYKVYASQIVYYVKEIEANSIDDAHEIAWESTDTDWEECDQYSDWELDIDSTQEVIE